MMLISASVLVRLLSDVHVQDTYKSITSGKILLILRWSAMLRVELELLSVALFIMADRPPRKT